MKTVHRKDASSKLRGQCRFLDDYNPPNLLHGYIFYSSIDHGIIESLDIPAYLSDFTIVTAKDIPGKNIVPEPVCDQPFLVEREVMHRGQVILAAAHESREEVKDMLKNIQVKYSTLTAITDTHQCMDNIKNQFGEIMPVNRSSTEDNASDDYFIYSDVFYTQHQEQAYLETQGMLADYRDGKMYITGTMQCPFFVKKAVEDILGNAVDDVIVSTSEGIGGAFGGKEDFPNLIAGIAALLSFKAKRPVKIVLDRSDDLFITTNRHPSRVEISARIDKKSKKLIDADIDFRLDAGAYQTLSPVVLHRGILHAAGGYHFPAVKIKGSLHRSNTPPNGAFRGFGCPQAVFAIESYIDNLAHLYKIPLLELKEANILSMGKLFPSGQIVKEGNLKKCLDKVLELSDYQQKLTEFEEHNKTHADKKGIGIALGLHGGGYTGNGEKVLKSKVKLVVNPDCKVEIYVANVEMGQGAHTTLAQMVADALNVDAKLVNVIIPNTSKTPNSGPTVASRTIYIVGNLLVKLCKNILAEQNEANLTDVMQKYRADFPKAYYETFEPDPQDSFDEKTNLGTAYHDFSWAACVIEISYNAKEYKINVDKCWNVLDVGKVINHEIALGQVYGGVTQALGWALSENIYKKDFPRISALTDYTLPTAYETPEMHVEFINTSSSVAKGLGEIPMDYPAPAVRNAFLQATGIMINELPLSPENIYKAIEENTK